MTYSSKDFYDLKDTPQIDSSLYTLSANANYDVKIFPQEKISPLCIINGVITHCDTPTSDTPQAISEPLGFLIILTSMILYKVKHQFFGKKYK